TTSTWPGERLATARSSSTADRVCARTAARNSPSGSAAGSPAGRPSCIACRSSSAMLNSPSALLQQPDLVHPAGMAPALVLRGEEGPHDLLRDAGAHHPRPEAEHVRVVVGPGHP